ncbi:Polyvinylalcohol dehydrogenase, partial [Mucuna pruriens]
MIKSVQDHDELIESKLISNFQFSFLTRLATPSPGSNSMTQRKYSMRLVLCLLLLCVDAAVVVLAASSDGLRQQSQDWLNHGGDLFNRRYACKEYKISPETAPNLRMKWKFYTGKDITATPAIYDGTLYFPSWNGNIYAVKEADGSLVWKQNLQNLTGLNATGFVLNVNWTVSRSTPTVAGDLLIVGIYGPAVVIAVKRTSGELVWKTTLDYHPAALITMSGTYYNGSYYVGTSSLEEGLPIEQCCIFRGSFAKLDARSGAILWKTYMLPNNNNTRGEYAGAAIWGSSPSIDVDRNHVYIATGNLYSAPLRILQCQERQNNQTKPAQPDECVEPENHSNSILALDLVSGNITWYRQLGGYDVWFFACINASTPNCPPAGPTPDADFGEAPMMLTTYVNRTKKDMVVAVQKSGFAWALDRNNGNLVWFTEAGPGGFAGGGTWGAATDERRVYTNIANSEAKNFTLAPSNMITTTGGWVAMDSTNGKILWSTANPSNSSANGPVSVANEVVFAGSTDKVGSIYAIDAKNGKILWSYQTGGSVYGGMSISNGCIYVGYGYNVHLGSASNLTGGTSLFAFCV